MMSLLSAWSPSPACEMVVLSDGLRRGAIGARIEASVSPGVTFDSATTPASPAEWARWLPDRALGSCRQVEFEWRSFGVVKRSRLGFRSCKVAGDAPRTGHQAQIHGIVDVDRS